MYFAALNDAVFFACASMRVHVACVVHVVCLAFVCDLYVLFACCMLCCVLCLYASGGDKPNHHTYRFLAARPFKIVASCLPVQPFSYKHTIWFSVFHEPIRDLGLGLGLGLIPEIMPNTDRCNLL